MGTSDMQHTNATRRFWIATFLLTIATAAVLMIRSTAATSPTPQGTGPFTGRVLSASAAPVIGATVHLVPTTAMDLNAKITASSIYAPPYPAEAYDEPLEDAIRLRGASFPHAKTDAQGNFSISNLPAGKFFIHVTPDSNDKEHLPGGDLSRHSYTVDQLRGRSMTIKVSSS